MLNPIPLSQWLSAPLPDDTPVAWQDDHLWTLGDLRHDVTQLVDTLRREDGERWALCIENGYLFIVALLATLHAGKTPVLPGHSRAAQLNEQRALFSGVLSDTTLDFQGRQLRVASAQRAGHPFSGPRWGKAPPWATFRSGVSKAAACGFCQRTYRPC